MLGAANLTLRSTGHVVPAFGEVGGDDGSLARFTINPRTAEAEVTTNRFSGRAIAAGDVLEDERGGGGGLGNPRRRSFENVLDDVLDGYITRDAAIQRYGADGERLDAAIAAWNAQG